MPRMPGCVVVRSEVTLHCTVVDACASFPCWFLTETLKAWPRPTAIAPIACAAPDARTAPPAPALIAGSAGMDPAVIKIALITLMALGCSLVIYSSALQAFNNHTGACVTVVTAVLPIC